MPLMRTPARAWILAVAVALGLALVMTAAGAASASPHAGVDSLLYRPAVDAQGVLSLDGGATLEQYDLSMQLAAGYGHRPLSVAVPGIGDGGDDDVLKFVLAVHMTVGFALSDRVTLAVDTGAYRTDTAPGYGRRGRYSNTGPEPSTGLVSLRPISNIDPSGGYEAQGLSGPLDTRVGVKVRVVGTSSVRVALLALASLPFGDEEMFLGDAGFVLSPRLAAEYAWGTGSKVVVNIGANLRQRTALQAYAPGDGMTEDDARVVLDIGSELMAGAGVNVQATPGLTLSAEGVMLVPLPESLALGSCRLASGERCSDADDIYYEGAGYGDVAGYAMTGLRYRATADTALSLAAGLGLVGARREDVRVMAGVVWTPVPADAPAGKRGQP